MTNRSKLRARWLALLVGLVGWTATPANAGDAVFGGTGVSLLPIAETRIRLRSEDVLMERLAPGGYRIGGAGEWRVSTVSRFENLTGEPVRLQIGFPEPACPDEQDCHVDGLRDLETRVRGESVPTRLGRVAGNAAPAQGVAGVHLFEVGFAAHETVEIRHVYRYGLSEQINGGESAHYLTRIGAGWAGPIAEARFRVRLPFRPWGLWLGDWGPHLTGLSETLVQGNPEVELVFERADWEPASDLDLYLGPGRPTLDGPALIEDCPAPGELFESAIDEQSLQAGQVRAATQHLSRAQLRICRNAVFAHHGRTFKDAALERFFYGDDGIKRHGNPRTRGGSHAVFARNPEFAPQMLSAEETAYVKAIAMAEKMRR